MRRHHYTLSCKNVSRCAVRWLVNALGWTTSVSCVGSELLVQLLVRAASEMRSLSAIVRQAQAAPSLETVRQALLKYLPSKPEDLLPATTRALHSRLPKSLSKRPRTMAIDWHLRPYYGASRTLGIYRGQPKASTKIFFAYASLIVIRRGQTFTIGLTPVVNGEQQTAVIARLLDQAKQAGLRVRRLLLDRGFYAAPTIQWMARWNDALLYVLARLSSAPEATRSRSTYPPANPAVKRLRSARTYPRQATLSVASPRTTRATASAA